MSEITKIRSLEKNERIYYIEFDDGSTKLVTENLVPGRRVYGERLYRIGGKEYREWNPFRSKLAAAIYNGIQDVPLRKGDVVLYLGAASGTTISHVSDIIGWEGKAYGVEFAPRVMRELLLVVSDRKNIIPILGDARKPWEYSHIVTTCDVLYADVAQPEQASLIVDNANYFLRSGGVLFFAIKARSIDVTQEPTEIYKREIEVLEKNGFKILNVVHLEPYDKDHAMVLARFK
ncbi:MAG: fibrillarin-like rRNA/tRNA 2'-O-methyltransferase [Desulfurococcales archaeon]|jgi:fibrillarin-like pre-rRNA processing protein|nr:fibrillarin-like rRNA/tRNA 2'-O-methyltransferase [Desulfurococcales archaeon]